jgi:tetratricopeptide (TPR) repeat protein
VQSRIAFALVALSVLVHWPFGHTDFVYDDVDFVRSNASIRSFDNALPAMLAPFPPGQHERGLYRPIVTLSHALDYAAFELDPRGHHLTNVALYGVVVWLVYALARRWFGDGSATAVAAALLFAMHPVHCDAVDTVSGRSELLALAFALAALLLFLRATPADDANPRRGLAVGSAVLYLLGCGSKETVVLLPAVLVLHLLARDGAPDGALAFARRALHHTSLHLGLAFVYLAIRLEALGGFGPTAPVLDGIGALARISTIGAVFAEYLRLLVWPGVLQLDFYYQQTIGVPPTPTLRSLIGWLGIAALLAGFGTAMLGALRARPSSLASPRGLWIAGVGSAFVFLLPVSHLLAIGALMAERFLFAPSLGFVLFATGLASHALRARVPDPRRRRLAAGVLVVALGAAGAARSALRAAEWRDGVRLWESLAELTPGDYRPHSNAATHWIERGEYDRAERALRAALALEQGDPAVHTNLAVVLLERGEIEAAESIHLRLIEADPGDHNAWFNLGVIEIERGRVSRALVHFERALAANPNYPPAQAQIAEARRRIEAARRYIHLHRVRARESDDPEFLSTYRRACTIAGEPCAQIAAPQ